MMQDDGFGHILALTAQWMERCIEARDLADAGAALPACH